MTTQETIKKAVDYAKENNIKNIVVATTTGGNLTYLEDEKDLHIVGVTNAYDQGQNQMREEVRKHFEEAGMDIVTAGHALSGAERCFSTYFGGYGPTEIVANTLRMFSQGVKVCVEVVPWHLMQERFHIRKRSWQSQEVEEEQIRWYY